jgi:CHAT domain-containing protein
MVPVASQKGTIGAIRVGSHRCASAALALLVAVGASAGPALERGEAALARGDFADAALALAEAVAEADARPSGTHDRVDARLWLAQAQRASGDLAGALETLEAARGIVDPATDPARAGAVEAALAAVYADRGERSLAEEHDGKAWALARRAEDPSLEARLLNDRGNRARAAGRTADALEAYRQSAARAEVAGQPEEVARALANAAAVAWGLQQPALADELASGAETRLARLPAGHVKATLLVHLGRTRQRLAETRPEQLARANALLMEGATLASELGDERLRSYALGYRGALYEQRGRGEEALRLTRRALRAADRAGAAEAELLWQWQSGRLLAAAGDRDAARAAYGRALALADALRPALAAASTARGASFRASTGAVYTEYVGLLLEDARRAGNDTIAEAARDEARRAVERLKAAELRDYFRDECVDALLAKGRGVEDLAPDAVVVYPVLLPDRLEILLSLPGGRSRQLAVPVTGAELTAAIHGFRRLLEKRTTFQFLPAAQALHGWLVAPWIGDVAPGTTLVFVPDGPLRTIPMAALHDGKHFLIERNPIATTPGLRLTDPRPVDPTAVDPLLVGLSAGAEGFAPLEHVPQELEAIQAMYGGEVLLDEDFRLDAVRRELAQGRFGVVHIATHAEFRGDADESFLLAYDGHLTLDRLEADIGVLRFREQPIELLTLSACETAAGDDRAALGLAGVAVKAGARSVLGTLWLVNDVAAADLVVAFYRELKQPGVSRAVALQRAQQSLLADLRFRHPAYWSAFVLIGSWL